MAYKIVSSSCTACTACEPECPNVAIIEKNGTFIIKPELCGFPVVVCSQILFC